MEVMLLQTPRGQRFLTGPLWGTVLICLLLQIAARNANADDVRRFIDAEGIVHISVDGIAAGATKAAGTATTESQQIREARYRPLAKEAAAYYQLPVPLVLAVIKVESNFYPMAVSKAGALGLMQLMPVTARTMHVKDPFDPRENIYGGCRLLRLLLNRFDGDLVLALSAYNAGEGAVLKREGVPYTETANYVRSVLSYYDKYRRQELGL